MMGRAKTLVITYTPQSQTIGASTSPGHVDVNINWTNPKTIYGTLIKIFADTSSFPATLIDTVFVAAGGDSFVGNLSIGSPPTFVRAELNYQTSLINPIPISASVTAGPTAI